MALKDILVCLDPTDAGEQRLRLAAALARRRGAQLAAAYLLPEAIPGAPPTPPTAAGWMPQAGLVAGLPATGVAPGLGADTDRGAAVADIVETRFREEVRPQDGDTVWHIFGAGESDDLLALATAADLIVIGQAAPDYRLPSGLGPEEIVVGSGRPVLIVPYAGAFDRIGRRAVVAWDGTREAARAVHDALPVLAGAEAVTVLTVADTEAELDDRRLSLDRIVRHLHRHGIAAQAAEAVGGDVPVADLLLSRAADFDADLIVAGAYHHSQFREALLGGVSRELLDHMTVPVLMAH